MPIPPSIYDPTDASFTAQTWVSTSKTNDGGASLAEAQFNVEPTAEGLSGICGALQHLSNIVRGSKQAVALDISGALTAGSGSISGTLAVDGAATFDADGAPVEVGGFSGNASVYATAGGSLVLRGGGVSNFRVDAATLRPLVDNSYSIGTAGTRVSSVSSYDGDFADDVTVGGDLTVGNGTGTNQINLSTGAASFLMGNGAGANVYRTFKGGSSTSVWEMYSTASLTTGARRIIHDDDEAVRFQYYNGSGWTTAFEFGAAAHLTRSTAAGITASTTQTQGQQPLTSDVNEISVCANNNDTVTLPSAAAGRTCIVINNGAASLRIFPASGDDLGNGVNTHQDVSAGNAVTYQAYDSTNWQLV